MRRHLAPALRSISLLTVLKHVFLAAFALLYILPFLWVILTSLKDPREFIERSFLPKGAWNWGNYLSAFIDYDLGRYYFNSLVVTSASVFIGLALSLFAGYALFRLRFRFKETVFISFVILMMLPQQLTLVAQFLLFQKMQILYTPWALILPYVLGVLPLSVFILRAFFKDLPMDLDHAARIDGASDLQIVMLILLPLAAPVLATACILTFMQTWNEFLLASIFVKREWYTLPVAAAEIRTDASRAGNQPQLYAALVISFLPLLVLFLFLQRYFVRGLASGAMKG